MEERYLSRIGVDILLQRENKILSKREILLLKRKNTGYYDGYYDLPGGFLEENEDIFDGMIRETKEELGITIKRKNMEILHIYHKYKRSMLKFVFNVSKFQGKLKNNEPDKCEKIEWFDENNLPKNIIPSINIELDNIKKNKYYSREE